MACEISRLARLGKRSLNRCGEMTPDAGEERYFEKRPT